MNQSSANFSHNNQELVATNPTGSSVQDVIKLLKNTKSIMEHLHQINFNVNAYNNRQAMGGYPTFNKNEVDGSRRDGLRLSKAYRIGPNTNTNDSSS